MVYIYWNIRILRELEIPLTVKELIKSGVKLSDLELADEEMDEKSDDEEMDEESDDKLEGDIDSNTEYEEDEFDLDDEELDKEYDDSFEIDDKGSETENLNM